MKQNNTRQERFWGTKHFTLIELLIVIAIIAILAGMLLPALNKARQTAQSVFCKSSQKQLYLAGFNYINDYEGWIPGIYHGYTAIADMSGPSIGSYLAKDYTSARKSFQCPSANFVTIVNAVRKSVNPYKLRYSAYLGGNDKFFPRNIKEFGRGGYRSPAPSQCWWWIDGMDGGNVYGHVNWDHVCAAGLTYATGFRHVGGTANFCTLAGNVSQGRGWRAIEGKYFCESNNLAFQDVWVITGRTSTYDLTRP